MIFFYFLIILAYYDLRLLRIGLLTDKLERNYINAH